MSENNTVEVPLLRRQRDALLAADHFRLISDAMTEALSTGNWDRANEVVRVAQTDLSTITSYVAEMTA